MCIRDRNTSALIIANEYCRIGIDIDSAKFRLEEWNRFNAPPLRISELNRALNNGYGDKYHYGCGNFILQSFCVGNDICPFNTYVKSKKTKSNDLAFLDYSWPSYISNRQVLIYAVALPYLEKCRQIGRGGLICANHKQIAKACGVSPGRVGKDLQALCRAGLIEYNVGQPRKWEGIASEIRRIFPIPRPTRPIIQSLKGFKNDMSSN